MIKREKTELAGEKIGVQFIKNMNYRNKKRVKQWGQKYLNFISEKFLRSGKRE